MWRMALAFAFAASAAWAGEASDISGIKAPSAANEHTLHNGYPEMSRKLYEEGVVTLKFTVGTDGKPHDIRVQHSSGYPRLDAAAMDEVGANWLYHPAMRNGEAIPVKLEANVRYSLRDDPVSGEHAVFRMTPEQFPPGTWNKGESGVTTFGVGLKADGSVINVETVHASGYGDLDAAALQMLDTMKFGAATLNGRPMASEMIVVFVWPANPEVKAQ